MNKNFVKLKRKEGNVNDKVNSFRKSGKNNVRGRKDETVKEKDFMRKKMKIIGVICVVFLACTVPAMAQSNVEDITKEVLTGPSELNPEKILGPGSIGIETGKDILMSFGATVRFIPTAESNWDFGMSDNVPGYVNTQPIKAFAGKALQTASTGGNLYTATERLKTTTQDSLIEAAFGEFSDALNDAYRVIGDPAIKQAVDGANQLSTIATGAGLLKASATETAYMTAIETAAKTKAAYMAGINAGSAAATAYQIAIQEKDSTVAGQALRAITTNPQYQQAVASGNMAEAQRIASQIGASYVIAAGVEAANAVTPGSGDAFKAIATNPAYQAATTPEDKQKAAEAVAAPIIAAASVKAANTINPSSGAALQVILNSPEYQAAKTDAERTAVAGKIIAGAVGQAANAEEARIIRENYQALLNGADEITKKIAQQITKNPNATPAEIYSALAYATVLKAKADSFAPFYLAESFLRTHSNESGSVNDGYIRNETKIYFNAMPKDKKWSFYAALEFDRPIDTASVDNRGGKNDMSSNFGLERLNASIELTNGLRLHGGWDVWGIDIIEAASMVYGDDNPGFWLNGKYKPIDFSIAWLKLDENDFQVSAMNHGGAVDNDRDLIAGYVDFKLGGQNKIRTFYAYDRIRSVPACDLLGSMAKAADLGSYAGINGGLPETDSHNIGAYYLGKFGMVELMAEGAYKFGQANETGLLGVDNGVHTIQYNDFDINSYAFSADIALELKDLVGWESLKPHIGFIYTSGDSDSTDDKLEGYSGVENAQRFSNMWGGENTIIGDTNFVLGTALYGYVPEFYGNGTPVFVGGLQNFAGNGNGRGDNPGLTMFSAGLTLRPKIYFIYRTNVNMFYWNEDFYVTNMVNPITLTSLASGTKVRSTKVEGGFAGTEWDNEFTMALSKHMYLKGQFSFFFPGEAVKEVTKALSGGVESDDTAVRIAAELIWNF